MYDKLADTLAAIIGQDIPGGPASDEYRVMRYGLKKILVTTINTLLLVIAARLLGILLEFAVFFVPYALFRRISYGVHFTNEWACILHGFSFSLGSVWIAIHCPFPKPAIILLLLLAALGTGRYAPSPTAAHPISPGKRPRLKHKSLAVLAVLSAAAILIDHPTLSTLLALAPACQTANLLPVTYAIARCRKGEDNNGKMDEETT